MHPVQGDAELIISNKNLIVLYWATHTYTSPFSKQILEWAVVIWVSVLFLAMTV